MLVKLLFVQLVILVIHGQAGEDSDFEPKIIEGDILADRKLLRIIESSRSSRQKRAARKDHLMLWPDGLIPYVISDDISAKLRRIIRRAFRRFAGKTCIRFIPKKKEYKDYVEFIEGIGCYSSVGKKSGRQVISLGSTCQSRTKAMHEIMHALGFFHEHSRPDRDNYVKILYWNIADNKENNFAIYSHDHADTLQEPYDFKSIMHYDNKAFTKNGRDTIQAKHNPKMRLGQELRLSRIDIRQVRKLYKCDRRRAKLDGSSKDSPCTDAISGCKHYADAGDSCEKNVPFMTAYCNFSCGFCGNG